jgi:hypothetical protein
MRRIPRRWNQPLWDPLKCAWFGAVIKIRTFVAAIRFVRSAQTKCWFIEIIVICTDNTIEVCLCANCGCGENRSARFGWNFRNVALHSQKVEADIASTGNDRQRGTRKPRKVPPAGVEGSKAFRDRRRAERESACMPTRWRSYASKCGRTNGSGGSPTQGTRGTAPDAWTMTTETDRH